MEGADPRTDGELLVATGLWLLDRLPSEQRDAVRARVIEGRGYDEIAADLSCSPSLVRKRVSRGLLRLRSDLETPRGA